MSIPPSLSILRRLFPLLAVFPLTMTAQTATWLGLTPADPARYSSWTTGSNWSTGIVPNGAGAIAILEEIAGNPAAQPRDGLQILNSNIALDELRYSWYAGTSSFSATFPRLLIGGDNPGDSGRLTLTGAGLTSPAANIPPGYYPPAIRLNNGDLVFAQSAHASTYANVTAANGTNLIWLRDDCAVSNLRIELGTDSTLRLSDNARLTDSNVLYEGGFVAAANTASVRSTNFYIYNPGCIDFSQQSRVSSGYFHFSRTGPATDSIVRFSGNATVSATRFNGYGGYLGTGSVEFIEQANGDAQTSLSFIRRLDISGASTGTGSTGRMRAPISGTNVIADDARIIDLGIVSVTDLLLGSNTLRLRGGFLYTIRDTGGAYLSASGANLTGGSLVKDGPGGLWLSQGYDPNPYPVPLTIANGYVYSYRDRLGAVTVAPAGVLYHYNGSVESLSNSGRIYVANTLLPVQGDFTQTATGQLQIPVSYSAANRLSVGGTATLAGELAFSHNYSNSFVGTRRLAVITADRLVGRFDTAPAITISAMLSVGIEYDANTVYVVYLQRPFAGAGATAAQRAMGSHLDATLDAAVDRRYYSYLRQLNWLTAPLVSAGLGQLAPDRYSVLNDDAFASSTSRQSTIDRRLALLRHSLQSSGGSGMDVFFEAGRRSTSYDAIDGLPAVKFHADSALAGAIWSHRGWSAGACVSSVRSSAALDGLGSHAAVESVAPGVFAQYAHGAFFVSAGAAYSRDDYVLRRNNGIIGLSSIVTARPGGSRTDLSTTTGFAFRSGRWSLTPTLGILSSRLQVDDFTESNESGYAGGELTITDWAVRSLRGQLGIDLAYRTKTGRFVPHVRVRWIREFEKDRSFSARLAETAADKAYAAPGRPADTNIVQTDLGLDCELGRSLALQLSVGGTRGRNSHTDYEYSAGLRWSF